MASYMIFGKSFKGAFTLVFNVDGTFNKLINETDIKEHDGIIDRIGKLPYEEKHIPALKAKGVRVERVPEDLSFETFWNSYAYKIGNKSRAKKLWHVLGEADKLKALQYIAQYDYYLSGRNIEKLYPETYLSQKRWEAVSNEQKTLFKS